MPTAREIASRFTADGQVDASAATDRRGRVLIDRLAPAPGGRRGLVLVSVDQIESATSDPELDQVPPRRRRRLTRRATIVLIGGLVLLLAGGGYALWALVLQPATPTTSFRTVTVASETLKQTVSATGTIQPARESVLSFASAGTVSSVKVSVGDRVAKGEKLAAIDADSLKIDRDAADAALTQSEQTLTDLEDDDDATSAQLAAAEADVKVKKAALAQAKEAVSAATLKAPFAGRIAAVGFVKGDAVGSSAGGSSSGSGSGGATNTSTSSSSSDSQTITLISNQTFVVDTSVSVADVSKIKKGLQATITPTGATDPVFGTVSAVAIVASSGTSSGTGSGSTASGSATFPVTIKVTGQQASLLPGSSATVAITVQQLSDVIAVPTQAVSTQNGATVVQKLVNGEQVATAVTLGDTVGTSTVITKGLQAGDQVVVASFTVRAADGTTRSQQQGGGFGQNGGFPGAGGQGPGGQAPGGANAGTGGGTGGNR